MFKNWKKLSELRKRVKILEDALERCEKDLEDSKRAVDRLAQKPTFVEVAKSFEIDEYLDRLSLEVMNEIGPLLERDALRIAKHVLSQTPDRRMRVLVAEDFETKVLHFEFQMKAATVRLKTY